MSGLVLCQVWFWVMFVFGSGLVLGQVYGRKMTPQAKGAVTSRNEPKVEVEQNTGALYYYLLSKLHKYSKQQDCN